MIISLIAAIGKNRGIGKNNQLLWHMPADMKHFREITRGHAVIMGQKTFESIGRPLPQRTNIVLSRSPEYRAEGCLVANSLEEALGKVPNEDDEVFVIGGGQIYELAMPRADKLYLTLIDANAEADVFFPKFDESEWNVISSEPHEADVENPHRYTFTIYERKK